MKFSIHRAHFLPLLQSVTGIVESRKTLPILSNILLKADSQQLSLISTDLEVELTAVCQQHQCQAAGEITLPGRKLLDICRALPEEAMITCELIDEKVMITSESSRFSLLTLPAQDFPKVEHSSSQLEFQLDCVKLRYLLENTAFSMAQQDVRYYLNGLLFELKAGEVNVVGTDGHRMSVAHVNVENLAPQSVSHIIVPRKGILEMLRLLKAEDNADVVAISVSENHIRVGTKATTLLSKLIDGRFPDYQTVLPRGGDKLINVPREQLKKMLTRAAILSNEKFRGICLQLRDGMLKVFANNTEQEEAEDALPLDYHGADLNIGVNVTYLLDVLNTVASEQVQMTFKDANTGILLQAQDDENSQFVIMPMRL
jgi:DNA polymerase-3 subunit beta